MSNTDKQNQPPSTGQNFPPMDPRLMAAMYGMPDEDEIDLLEYWRLIWRNKWLIILVSLLVGVVAAAISLQMPNIYKAEVLLAPASESKAPGGGLGGLGGLAALAGVSIGGGGNVEKSLAVLKSRKFLWQFITEEKLLPKLFEDDWDAVKKGWRESADDEHPDLWDGYRGLLDILSATQDKKSGLITVAIEWRDADLAAEWANKLVVRLNDFLRQQAIARSKAHLQYLERELMRTELADNRQALYTLISQEQKKSMLANTQKEFAFQVIDRAVAPDKKSKPKRSLIVLLSMFVAGFLMVVLVFIREGVARRRESES
ncbi:MAG: Wzz/FepE/Etk N-terminal domain-containing protein [Mariprofundales bacterium]|nr:Wzz/FepE/Etk N-terminal domain-containing protein [Mariprofundales bacterium]